ncbi:MAG: type II secretion system F family protein [Euzebya sp.]
MPLLIGYLAAGMIGLGVAVFAVALGRRQSVGVEALARAGVANASSTTVPGRADEGQRTSLTTRLTDLAVRMRPGREAMSRDRAVKVRARLDSAGLAMPVEALLALKVSGLGAGLVLGLLVSVVFSASVVASLVILAVTSLIGYLATDLYVLSTAQRRQQQIQRSIPETLDLLALTAQAGLGLEQGVAEIAGELPGPLGAELDRFLKEQQLGRDRQAALRGLIDRNSSEDLQSFALALLQADQLGTPISTTLQVQAREMRRRRRAHARERAGKAPVKLLFPLIFGIFPALFVIIMGPGALAIMEAFS